MTGNKCLLDTCIVINTFKSDNKIAEVLDAISEIYLPANALGELFYGAFRSANKEKHLQQIVSFTSYCKILSCDSITASFYGKIKTQLSQKGTPIPENDIWIAAAAMQHELPLFTTDRHFSYIEDLHLL